MVEHANPRKLDIYQQHANIVGYRFVAHSAVERDPTDIEAIQTSNRRNHSLAGIELKCLDGIKASLMDIENGIQFRYFQQFHQIV